MAVDLVPLQAWDTDAGTYRNLGLHLLPEYYAREAARFAGYRWNEFCALDGMAVAGIVAHWFANRMFNAHENDAAALRHEAEAAK